MYYRGVDGERRSRPRRIDIGSGGRFARPAPDFRRRSSLPALGNAARASKGEGTSGRPLGPRIARRRLSDRVGAWEVSVPRDFFAPKAVAGRRGAARGGARRVAGGACARRPRRPPSRGVRSNFPATPSCDVCVGEPGRALGPPARRRRKARPETPRPGALHAEDCAPATPQSQRPSGIQVRLIPLVSVPGFFPDDSRTLYKRGGQSRQREGASVDRF